MAATVQQHTEDIASLRQELAKLQAELQSPTKQQAHAAGAKTAVANTSASEDQRRLQQDSTPTYAAMPAWQLHEFPNAHSCSLGSRMRLLPKSRVGDSLSWSISHADAASDLSLVTVGGSSYWATSEIQTMPTPFKVVHDASCSSSPTLDLPLSTTVQTLTVSGTLTVGSTDIGAALSPHIKELAVMMCNFGTGSPSTGTGRGVASSHEVGGGNPTTREDCVRNAWDRVADGTLTDVRGVTWGANQGNACWIEVGGCTPAQGCATPNMWTNTGSTAWEACRFPAFN